MIEKISKNMKKIKLNKNCILFICIICISSIGCCLYFYTSDKMQLEEANREYLSQVHHGSIIMNELIGKIYKVSDNRLNPKYKTFLSRWNYCRENKLVVINENGEILFGKKELYKELMKQISKEQILNKKNSTIIESVNNEKIIISFLKSDVLKCTFISVRSIQMLKDCMIKKVLFLLSIMGGIFILIFFKKIYFYKREDEKLIKCEEIDDYYLELEENLNDTIDQDENKIEQTNNIYVEEIIKILNEEYAEDISLNLLGEKLNISPVYLSRIFKEEVGKTFIEYLTEYRIEKSKVLLFETDLKVKEIAQKVGYHNSYYFIRVFKKHMGTTPGEYRKCS